MTKLTSKETKQPRPIKVLAIIHSKLPMLSDPESLHHLSSHHHVDLALPLMQPFGTVPLIE